MTVERYIRIFAGLFILISLSLGIEQSPLFVSKWALAFTAFVGLNLLQFGFTNMCPMGFFLRKLGVPDGKPGCGGGSCGSASQGGDCCSNASQGRSACGGGASGRSSCCG